MRIFSIIILMLFIQSSFAVTYVYFQNNSPSSFTVNIQQSGTHTLSASEWNASASSVASWEGHKEMMWTNRNTGIHMGDDFYFDVVLNDGVDSITLKVKLTGTFTASDMWIAASGPGFSHPWYADNNFHQADFVLNGANYRLKYHSYFTGGYDDLYFALQKLEPYPIAAADTSNQDVFNVLAYNIYMLTPPIALTDQSDRAAVIAEHVKGYDAIIFSEAFYNSARTTLQTNLSAEYPYFTAVVDNGVFNDDGGVFIASRYPIVSSAQIVYDDCNGSDCLAAKGVMYAKINKKGRNYHLFGTHTQAWNTAADVATRILQFKALKNFVQSQQIPLSEAVLIGGDLNVDMLANNLGEYDGMLDSLQLMEPLYLGHPSTYDGAMSYYASPGVEFLDYVMSSNDYLLPDSASNKVLILRSVADNMFNKFDLSDHLAVHGRFVFSPIATATAELPTKNEWIKIYPNPSFGLVRLDFADRISAQIRIINALGQVLLNKTLRDVQSASYDLSDYEPGIYYVNVAVEGQAVYTQAIVLQQ